jgi:hypothetical protein
VGALTRKRSLALDRWATPRSLARAALRAKVVREQIGGWLTQRHGDSPRRGFGVDRGVDRRSGKSQRHMCFHSNERVASLLVKRTLRTSVLLLIRWFRVRPPSAPPALLLVSGSIRGPTQIELGKLLAPAQAGRQPDSGFRTVRGAAARRCPGC